MFGRFIVWQETIDHDRAVAIGMCTLSLTEEFEGFSLSLSGKRVENRRLIELLYLLGKCEVMAEGQEPCKNAINLWLAKGPFLSVSTAVKDFSLMRMPCILI